MKAPLEFQKGDQSVVDETVTENVSKIGVNKINLEVPGNLVIPKMINTNKITP